MNHIIKPFSLFVFLLISITACQAQYTKKPYHIKGTIKGLAENSMIIFAQYYGDKQYVRDTVYTDASGAFVLNSKDSVHPGMYLFILPDNSFFDVILNEQFNLSFQTQANSPIEKIKFKDNPENTAFYDYLQFIKEQNDVSLPLREQLKDTTLLPENKEKIIAALNGINEKVKTKQIDFINKYPDSFFSSILKAQQEPVVPEPTTEAELSSPEKFKYHYFVNHFWDNVNLSDGRLIHTPVIHSKLNQFFTQIIIPLPDTIAKYADYVIGKTNHEPEMFKYIVWFLTNHYERSPYLGMDAVFVHLVENYYTNGQAYWLTDEQQKKIIKKAATLKPLLLGKVTPDILAYDTKGDPIALSSVKSDFLVLYFWDSDCSHCKKVTPALHALYLKYKDKGLDVFALNTEQTEDTWLNYVSKNNLSWINVNDKDNKSGFREKYDLYATPLIILLDKDKKIIAKKISPEQLEELLKREMGL